MATTRIHLGAKAKSFTIAAGNTLEVILSRATGGSVIRFGSQTFTAIPGGGGTMDIEFSTSPFSSLEAGTAVWADWALGVASATLTDSLVGPITAVRATAIDQQGVFEVVP